MRGLQGRPEGTAVEVDAGSVLNRRALALLRRGRNLGLLTLAALLAMAVFAAAAHASSVTNVSVTNTSPTDAAGARTVYSISFSTSSTGALSTAANSAITITFPTGTVLSNVNSSEILTANNTNIGDCSLNQNNLTATCTFFSNETVGNNTMLTVQLGGVINPPVPAARHRAAPNGPDDGGHHRCLCQLPGRRQQPHHEALGDELDAD